MKSALFVDQIERNQPVNPIHSSSSVPSVDMKRRPAFTLPHFSIPHFTPPDFGRAFNFEFLRAFPQAPWRTQTQAVAAWAITLLIVAVLGGLYLAVAARAGTAGRDLQFYEARKADLIRSNDELRASLAQLRSVTRLANRARELGFQPAQPDQIDYLAVPNYPHPSATQTAVANVTPAPPPTLSQWLVATLNRLITGGGG